MNEDGGVDEETILPFMPRIARTYGAQTVICYFDVDFHGKVIPHAYTEQKWDTEPVDLRLYGSGIVLKKDVFGSDICLSIDEVYDDVYYDPKPYVDAMRALLGGQKYNFEDVRIYSTHEELARAERQKAECQPAVAEARDFFKARIKDLTHQKNLFDPTHCKVTPTLKKEAKKRGYAYSGTGNFGWYEATKKTPNNNELVLTFDHPQFFEVRIGLTFHAPNVQKALFFTTADPEKQEDYDAFVSHIFESVAEYERTMMQRLDGCFDATPAWFGHVWSNPMGDPELK